MDEWKDMHAKRSWHNDTVVLHNNNKRPPKIESFDSSTSFVGLPLVTHCTNSSRSTPPLLSLSKDCKITEATCFVFILEDLLPGIMMAFTMACTSSNCKMPVPPWSNFLKRPNKRLRLSFSSSSLLSLLEAAGSEEEEESMMVRPGRLLLVLAGESVAGRSGFIPMSMRQVQNARIGSTKSRNGFPLVKMKKLIFRFQEFSSSLF